MDGQHARVTDPERAPYGRARRRVRVAYGTPGRSACSDRSRTPRHRPKALSLIVRPVMAMQAIRHRTDLHDPATKFHRTRTLAEVLLRAFAKGRDRVVIDLPVLVVGPAVLVLVEVHEPAQVLRPLYASEQVGQLCRLARGWPDASLGYQNRLLGELPDCGKRGFEHGAEDLSRLDVVSIDADPVDIFRAGPPCADRGLAGGQPVDDPQPGHVKITGFAKDGHDM